MPGTGRSAGRLLIFGAVLLVLVLLSTGAPAADRPVMRVAYAGSMGAVMDDTLGPDFARTHAVRYQGVGQGSYALARLIAGRQLQADVFVGITPGPMRVLQKAGLVGHAVPVASTRMVVIYSPGSRFAADFAAAARGDKPWYEVLHEAGLRLGRTDPAIDPQGANALLTLQLAEQYYQQPGLLEKVAGPLRNPRQIFAETSLMSRLEAGQIDAAVGYLSAAQSHHLPTIDLPPEIDLAHPAMQDSWYARAEIELPGGKTLRAQPLVFYAAVPSNARAPRQARDFIRFLRSGQGQAVLREHGYDPPHGGRL